MVTRFLTASFFILTIIAMLVGVVLGLAFGENAAFLGEIARWIIQLIKALAAPLLFLAILDAVLRAQFRAKGMVSLLCVAMINATLACAIGLAICDIVRPGLHLREVFAGIAQSGQAVKKTPQTWIDGINGFVPESLVGPFTQNLIPAIIVIALIVGFGMRAAANTSPQSLATYQRIQQTVEFLLQVFLKILEAVVRWVPLAVLGSVAKVVGAHGLAALGGLAWYLVACFGGMSIHVFFVYQSWVKLSGRKLSTFWREVKEPVVYAFGVNSSLATLPLTLRALDRLKVSPGSARLSACVGTNLNNDGILLYEVMAAMIVADACGFDFTLLQQLALAGVALLATVGVAGIPEAGIISLTLVLSSMGLPTEAIPLLLTVDWLIARCRSVVNVLGDITVAIAIDRFQDPEPTGLPDSYRRK